MKTVEKIRWTDMIDPVYTLAQLAGVDPDNSEIHLIKIDKEKLMVIYDNSIAEAVFDLDS